MEQVTEEFLKAADRGGIVVATPYMCDEPVGLLLIDISSWGRPEVNLGEIFLLRSRCRSCGMHVESQCNKLSDDFWHGGQIEYVVLTPLLSNKVN